MQAVHSHPWMFFNHGQCYPLGRIFVQSALDNVTQIRRQYGRSGKRQIVMFDFLVDGWYICGREWHITENQCVKGGAKRPNVGRFATV